MSQGWNPESPEDHALRVVAWLEVLGIAQIPVSEYEDLYRRAIRTRIEKEAAGTKLFTLAPTDLVAEYRLKNLKVVEPDDEWPADQCPEKHNHLSADEALQDYGFPGEAEEWLPCHVCRRRAHGQRRTETRAKRIAAFINEQMAARPSPNADEATDIDTELDGVTAARRAQPENEILAKRYEQLLARKAESIREDKQNESN